MAGVGRTLGSMASAATTFVVGTMAVMWTATTKAKSFWASLSRRITTCQRPRSEPSLRAEPRTTVDALTIGLDVDLDAELVRSVFRDLWMNQGGLSSYLPEEDPRWVQLNIVDPVGRLTSVNTYQVDSFVHFLDVGGTCVCGPHVVVVDDPNVGPVTLVTHNEWELYDDDDED